MVIGYQPVVIIPVIPTAFRDRVPYKAARNPFGRGGLHDTRT